MLMLIAAKDFLDTKAGRLVALCCIGGVVFGVWLWRHDDKVTSRAIQRIEKQDATNVKKAHSAGARSRDPRTRGVLDPYQRADD